MAALNTPGSLLAILHSDTAPKELLPLRQEVEYAENQGGPRVSVVEKARESYYKYLDMYNRFMNLPGFVTDEVKNATEIYRNWTKKAEEILWAARVQEWESEKKEYVSQAPTRISMGGRRRSKNRSRRRVRSRKLR
jgi:hypothetical protein